jgi:carbonic anhydrase
LLHHPRHRRVSIKPTTHTGVAPDDEPARLADDLLEGNRRFVATDWDRDDADLLSRPRRRLAVVACMDTRHNVERVLGLAHGDAKIIRNAGNILDDGTLRSLLVAVHVMGVHAVAVMGHTKCGMTQVGHPDYPVAHGIAATTDVPFQDVMRPDFQRWLGGFEDPEAQVRRSVRLMASHPLLPRDLFVMGLLYDNDTGRVRRVE